MDRRILVCGGAGFIGSHLCDRLIGRGDNVICVDNFYTGQVGNLEGLLGLPQFTLLTRDVTEPLDVVVDEIYNLACPASPVHYQSDPVRTLKTSVLGAINLLELAERLGVPIVQASTSEIYGEPERHPQSEDYHGNVNCVGPRACYDEGKRCAETLMSDYRSQHGVDTRVARIFNTYGPRMHHADGRVVCNFIVQTLRNEPLTIYGDGSQTRSFCYVDDMVNGLMGLMACNGELPHAVNLGNPNEMTVLQLAELVITLTGSASRLIRLPLPQDDPTRRRPDIGRAERLLNWRPTVPLVQGLRATIAYFEEQLGRDQDVAGAMTDAA
jgi:UDP-glucuronate decarboxylase